MSASRNHTFASHPHLGNGIPRHVTLTGAAPWARQGKKRVTEDDPGWSLPKLTQISSAVCGEKFDRVLLKESAIYVYRFPRLSIR